jgi:hypothetical protein
MVGSFVIKGKAKVVFEIIRMLAEAESKQKGG